MYHVIREKKGSKRYWMWNPKNNAYIFTDNVSDAKRFHSFEDARHALGSISNGEACYELIKIYTDRDFLYEPQDRLMRL